MRKGLPKWAIEKARAAGAKNIFAYAWSLVRKGVKGNTSPKRHNPGRNTMAKGRRGRKRNMLSKMGGITGLAGGLAAAHQLGAILAARQAMAGQYDMAAATLKKGVTATNVVTAVTFVAAPLIIKKIVRSLGVKIPGWL